MQRFLGGQLKHEVGWKSLDVALYDLNERPRFVGGPRCTLTVVHFRPRGQNTRSVRGGGVRRAFGLREIAAIGR